VAKSPAVCTHVQDGSTANDPFNIQYVASSTYSLSPSSFKHPYAYLEYVTQRSYCSTRSGLVT